VLLNRCEFATIKELWDESTMSIVDGQHREGGLIGAHDRAHDLMAEYERQDDFNPPVPLMLFFGLSYEEEAELFDTINSTQRKLPKALIEVTKGDITERGEHSHAQKIREIAFALARDDDSVWSGLVNMTGACDPDRKITWEGLRRSTANMFPAELVGRIEASGESPIIHAKQYWRTVSQACAGAWDERPDVIVNSDGETEEVQVPYRLKELVGVAALARLGKDIIVSAIERSPFRNQQDTVVDYVSKLSEVDWRKSDQQPVGPNPSGVLWSTRAVRHVVPAGLQRYPARGAKRIGASNPESEKRPAILAGLFSASRFPGFATIINYHSQSPLLGSIQILSRCRHDH